MSIPTILDLGGLDCGVVGCEAFDCKILANEKVTRPVPQARSRRDSPG